ncbi:MAG: hypothetical protein IPM24_20050 [Bryobacterales bacterium]|nr:hypothetical protein [Bryobacterales bacterium]
MLEVPEVTEPTFSKDDDLVSARVIVRLSALLHDVRHCRLPHAVDTNAFKSPGRKRYKQKDYSSALILYLLADVIDGHPLNHMKVTAEENICNF